MKIYLSGKITGEEKEAHELFEKEDLEVINPMKLNHNHDKSWESYMKECIKYLVDCDVVLLVGNDWNDSRGVELEVYIARSLGIPIVSKKIVSNFVVFYSTTKLVCKDSILSGSSLLDSLQSPLSH